MEKLSVKVRKELRAFHDTQEKLISHYNSEQNYEMAYLVRWSILEKLVKTIAAEYRRDILVKSLQDWLTHLKKDTPKPSKKPNTAIDLITLPHKSEFIASLNYFGLNGDSLWSVMDSNGRHRRHRNELAHTGKKFINYLLYHSLIADLEQATIKVFSEIEHNKSIKNRTRKKRATT